MAFTTDVGTDIGQVRLLLHDLDSTKPIFPDDSMIQALLNLEDGSVKLAAALGMETIAANRVMILQVIQLLDLKTDGKSVAQGLLATAEQIRKHANDDWAGIDFAQVTDDSEFSYRDYLWKLIVQQNAN